MTKWVKKCVVVKNEVGRLKKAKERNWMEVIRDDMKRMDLVRENSAYRRY